jgi:hypothetical protein
VCGYIALCNDVEINWTKAAKSTAKEKAHRDEVNKGRLITIKKERMLESGDAMNPNEEGLQSYLQHFTKLVSDYEGVVAIRDNNEESFQFVHIKCPIGVTFQDIKKVTKLLELK